MGAIRGGVRYVRNAPALQSVLLRTGSFVIFGSALWALLPLVVRNELARGPSAYGMTLGALGAGALIGAVLLPRLKSRFSLEILVDCNIALFGAVSIGTALVHSYSLLLIVLLAGGIAWITLLSQLNLAARSVVPAWIEARALASYLLVFQGGTAIGSLVWGAIAAKMGLRFSLVCAGSGLFLNLLLVFRYSMSRVAAVNAAPAGNWPAPPPLDDSFSANAPALVTIKYQVKETRSQDFATAMYELEVSRRRDGALYWGLFADPAESGLYIEQFLVESWTEHLRQHERTTVDDRMLQDAIRSMLSGAELPLVDHYIAHEHFSHTKRT